MNKFSSFENNDLNAKASFSQVFYFKIDINDCLQVLSNYTEQFPWKDFG